MQVLVLDAVKGADGTVKATPQRSQRLKRAKRLSAKRDERRITARAHTWMSS